MAGELKKFVKLLMEVGNDARLEITKENIHSRIIDEASVAVIDVTLNKTAFIEYETGEEQTLLGVDLVKLNEIIGSAGKLSEVALEELDGRIQIAFDGMLFELPLLDAAGIRTCRVPTVPYTVTFDIDTEFIRSAIRGVKIVGGDVVIEAENETVTFKAKSDTGNSFKFPVVVGGNFDKTVSMYAEAYVKTLSLFEGEVEISYGSDLPMMVKMINENMSVWYMMAPRLLN
jgi:proliferating cell nuclear antigen